MKKRETTMPGEILVQEFLQPLGISQNQLALHTSLPISRINTIVRGQRTLTPETALRFARFFGNSPEFWLNLQMLHDLNEARLTHEEAIAAEVRPYTRKVA